MNTVASLPEKWREIAARIRDDMPPESHHEYGECCGNIARLEICARELDDALADIAGLVKNLCMKDEASVMLALANRIVGNAHPAEDARLEVAYEIARYLKLDWPAALATPAVEGDTPDDGLCAEFTPERSNQARSPNQCPACNKCWGEHRPGYSASQCRMKEPQPDARGVEDLPAQWDEMASSYAGDVRLMLTTCAAELRLRLAATSNPVQAEQPEGKGAECEHKRTEPRRTHVRCLDCESIMTDSDASWGAARNRWFPSLPAARAAAAPAQEGK